MTTEELIEEAAQLLIKRRQALKVSPSAVREASGRYNQALEDVFRSDGLRLQFFGPDGEPVDHKAHGGYQEYLPTAQRDSLLKHVFVRAIDILLEGRAW